MYFGVNELYERARSGLTTTTKLVVGDCCHLLCHG
jgi:hypothetical protein